MPMYMQNQYSITSAKILSPSEEASLRAVLGRGLAVDKDRRNALLFLLLLETGVRANELLNLKIKNFSHEEGALAIKALKSSRDRELPIREGLARALKKCVLSRYNAASWRELNPDAPLFDLSYPRLYQLWRFYTPNPNKTIHSLRHTFAINLYKKSKDVKMVQIALGHKNILNTMVYVDFYYSQNTLRKIMTG